MSTMAIDQSIDIVVKQPENDSKSIDAEPPRGTSAGAKADTSGKSDVDAGYRALAESAIAAKARGDKEPGLLHRIVHKASSYASFAPMIVVGVIPDIRLAALVSACIALFNFGVSSLLYWLRVYKIWPKVFELVNIAIYLTIMVLSFVRPKFTQLWLPLFTSGLTGTYFVASLLAKRPFSHELAKESAPQDYWDNAAFKRLNFNISLWWAVCIKIVALSAVVFAVNTTVTHRVNDTLYLVFDVVLGIAPLVVAMVAQHVLVHLFRRRIKAEAMEIMAARLEGAQEQEQGSSGQPAQSAAAGPDSVV